MHVTVVTVTGAKDIDAGVKFLEEKVISALSSHKGCFIASADREGGVFAVVSLWNTAEDRDASEAALAAPAGYERRFVGFVDQALLGSD